MINSIFFGQNASIEEDLYLYWEEYTYNDYRLMWNGGNNSTNTIININIDLYAFWEAWVNHPYYTYFQGSSNVTLNSGMSYLTDVGGYCTVDDWEFNDYCQGDDQENYGISGITLIGISGYTGININWSASCDNITDGGSYGYVYIDVNGISIVSGSIVDNSGAYLFLDGCLV